MSKTLIWQEKQKALGLCLSCLQPSADGTRCEYHAERNRIANRNRYRLKHGIPLNEPYEHWGRPRKNP